MNKIIIIVVGIIVAILLVFLICKQSVRVLTKKRLKEKELKLLEEEAQIMPIKETPVVEEEKPDEVVATKEEAPIVEETKEEVETEPEAEPEIKEEVKTEEPKDDSIIEKEEMFFDTDVMYSRSFKAKTIQTCDETKQYYSELKNELLSYKGVKSRISWDKESFNIGRKYYARMTIKGKTLMLYLALNPKEYINSKYLVEDVSDVSKYANVPTLYRIKGDRRLKYAKELIAILFQDIEKKNIEPVSYIYDYQDTAELIDQGLIKIKQVATKKVLIKEKVDAGEVSNLITDEDAEKAKIIIKQEVNSSVKEIHVKIKKSIINIDELAMNFKANELVTLKKLIEKGIVNKNTNYLKVLARGYLDKPLRVEANEFSIDAIKMITVTGGHAIQIK